MRPILAALALTFVLTACGGATGSSSSSGPSSTASSLVTGVYLQHDSSHPDAGTPVGGVTIGVYPRAISSGPVMADPPQPLATVETANDGSFSFHVDGRRRVFLAAIKPPAYSVGHWVVVGGPKAMLTGCTDCLQPMSAG